MNPGIPPPISPEPADPARDAPRVETMTRQEFLRAGITTGAALFAGTLLSGVGPFTQWAEAAPANRLVIATTGSMDGKIQAIFQALGGIGRFVKRGSRVVLKPNVAWARTPAEAANTHPELVAAVVRLCLKAGARSVTVYENSCDNYHFAFERSGVQDAVIRAGGKMYAAHDGQFYRSERIPRGKVLRQAEIIGPALDADCLINMPIAKVHGGSILTLGLKNFMGLVRDRSFWHSTDLQQCIADCATRIRPHLTILDATRILLTNGPKGPGEVRKAGIVAAGTDPIAVDSYGAALFGRRAYDIPHIREAARFGIGELDLRKVSVSKIS